MKKTNFHEFHETNFNVFVCLMSDVVHEHFVNDIRHILKGGDMNKKKRNESFVGIHFDFHANDDCTEIGKTTTPEMIQKMIDVIKPDFIQCDCKGHRGLSSYPTKVAYPAPGFEKDNLRIWREVTEKNHIALYMHYSGVWDTEAIKHHPDWARFDEEGKADPNNTSVFGPYVDELLIPQLKELIDEYHVDGIWVDGECWATCQDYGEKVIGLFQEKTGIMEIPKKLGDPYFFEFTEFCREGFRKYLNHYVTEIHKHNKDFQIASNWAYSSFMPEEVNIDIDYISGDYTLLDSYNSARLESRCMAFQGKPWDLMAWAFSGKFREPAASTKSIPQMKQEAAAVLSVGGGFQGYFKQKRDGSINLWEMKLMGEIADFCRERQVWCHQTKSVPQVALLNSSYDYYRKCRRIFSPWNGELTALRGNLMNLLENQYSVDIVSEHHIKGRMQAYPLIVLPETTYLDEAFKAEIIEYVENGGNLLLIGPAAGQLFHEQAGVELTQVLDAKMFMEADELIRSPVRPFSDTHPEEQPSSLHLVQWLEYDNWMAGFYSLSVDVKLKDGTREFGKLFDENDQVGASRPAASIRTFGKGKIAAIWMNMGERYINGATSLSHKFMGGLVNELFEQPIVKVTGSKFVDVSVNTKEEALLVHLVNTSGPHGDNQIYVFDEIPKIGPLNISITCCAPESVVLQPEGTPLPFDYQDGSVRLVLDRLDIYSIIEVKGHQ